MLEGDLRWHVGHGVNGFWDGPGGTSALLPVVNGEPTVAYLWARTVRDIQTEGRIPILKTFMLCRKKGKRVALLPVPDTAKRTSRSNC